MKAETKKLVQSRRKETLKAIESLCLLDDNLMTLVFDRNVEATELLLKIILQRDDLKVLEAVAQRDYKNPMPGGRSITLDIYAQDRDKKVYDIEVQRAPKGADVRRARFHSSMIDVKMLKARQEFKEIHDSYVIFITADDILGEGHSLYHINRVVEETGVYFGDGSHIIYVNGSYKNDNHPVGRLMHDFRCVSSADMFYPTLAKQVKYFKETGGGQGIMCQVFEDLAEKIAMEIAGEMAEERAVEEKKAFACRMIARGKLTIEEIAEDADLPLEVVQELAGFQPV